jgi:hypothetical protein
LRGLAKRATARRLRRCSGERRVETNSRQTGEADEGRHPRRLDGPQAEAMLGEVGADRVEASKASSSVPNPPGKIRKAHEYFTNTSLRTKKYRKEHSRSM